MKLFKRLDRYILRKYFTTFFFTAFLFSVIAVVLDASQKVEQFIESGVSAEKVVFEYYLNFIPWINGLLWPLFALLSVIFFTSRLARNSELIAALSAGVSFNRLIVPYLVASGLLTAVHLLGNHIFIPQGNKTYIAFENTYVFPNNLQAKTDDIHIKLNPSSSIKIQHYRMSDTSMRGVYLQQFEGQRLTKLIKAERMNWNGAPNKWSLVDYTVRTFDEDGEESLLIAKGESLDTVLNLIPEDFVRFVNQREMMTTRELQEFINYERNKGLGTAQPMVTEIHRRTADPFTIMILTIIGMAVAARKVRGGMGVHLAVGITVGALYIMMSRFSVTFASQLSLSPGFAVWVPNILFSAVALYLVFRAQK